LDGYSQTFHQHLLRLLREFVADEVVTRLLDELDYRIPDPCAVDDGGDTPRWSLPLYAQA
jgi:hypothetical protein